MSLMAKFSRKMKKFSGNAVIAVTYMRGKLKHRPYARPGAHPQAYFGSFRRKLLRGSLFMLINLRYY